MSAPGTKADHLQSGDRRLLVTLSGHSLDYGVQKVCVPKNSEAVEKLPPVSESLQSAENLYFHYCKRSSFCLSLYFGPRLDGPY